MGLSVAIAGAIILSTLMLVLMSMSGMVSNIFSIGETSSRVFELEKSISQTDIDLDSLLAAAGSPRVNFTLNNDEQEKFWQFKKFNVILQYEGVTSGRLLEELSYSGKCSGGVPAVGNWCIELISGIIDPGILNNGESAIIRTQVSENLANGNAIVSLSTDNGVVATLPSFKPTSFDISSDPPVPCQIGFYGRTFQDTDTGISYVCDSSRDKWLSIETADLYGETKDGCGPGEDPTNQRRCAVKWGNDLGPDDVLELGLYIPYNATITAYGFSMDDDRCTSGSFDIELWGSGANNNDEPQAFIVNLGSALVDEIDNNNSLNIDLDPDQYISWGMDNNCGQTLEDWNTIIYLKWRHDNP